MYVENYVQCSLSHYSASIKSDSNKLSTSGKHCLDNWSTSKLFYLVTLHNYFFHCLTFINANSITVKFNNCKETYWTQIGTNVNLWVIIANSITAIANGFGKTNYCFTIK